jgi:hypothetical protein
MMPDRAMQAVYRHAYTSWCAGDQQQCQRTFVEAAAAAAVNRCALAGLMAADAGALNSPAGVSCGQNDSSQIVSQGECAKFTAAAEARIAQHHGSCSNLAAYTCQKQQQFQHLQEQVGGLSKGAQQKQHPQPAAAATA